jgi:hypothetical protein
MLLMYDNFINSLVQIIIEGTDPASIPFDNPDERNLVAEVSLEVRC